MKWGSGLLVVVIALTLWAAFTEPSKSKSDRTTINEYVDADLYQAVTARSGDYYSRTFELHRRHDYPLRPFYTVRLPTLAAVTALLGPVGMTALLWSLLLAALGAWLWRLRRTALAEKLAALFFIGIFSAPLMNSIYFHDIWAGVLLVIALGCGRAAFGFLAAIVRELTLPFLLSALAVAIAAKAQRVPFVIATTAALIALTAHAVIVTGMTLPTDLASPGWLGLRGPAGFVSDLRTLTGLALLPFPVACLVAFAPLLGWYQLRDWQALLWFAGFMAGVMIFGRANTFYWAGNIIPAYFVGLAFLPRFLRETALESAAFRNRIEAVGAGGRRGAAGVDAGVGPSGP